MSKQNVAKEEGVSYALYHAHGTQFAWLISHTMRGKENCKYSLFFNSLKRMVEMTNGSQMIINGREKR